MTKYLDLQDSIILMVHKEESMQTEKMEVIKDVNDLQRGDVVEVVISSEMSPVVIA